MTGPNQDNDARLGHGRGYADGTDDTLDAATTVTAGLPAQPRTREAS